MAGITRTLQQRQETNVSNFSASRATTTPRAFRLASATARRRFGEPVHRRPRVRAGIAFGAVLSVLLASAAVPAVAGSVTSQTSSDNVVGLQAAAGTAFRVKLESDCSGDGGCQFDFGKKAKARTVTAVTCLLQLVDDAVGVVGTIKIGDDPGFDYFIPVASTARFASGQGATFVHFEDFEVPARQRLGIVIFPSGVADKAFCNVTGRLN